MAYSKVVLDGTTLIDLTQDTVVADSMLYGVTAHKNDGTTITGTLTSVVPSFKGGAITGTGTITGDSCSISSSTNNSGVSISADCLITTENILYDGDTQGIIDKDNNDVAMLGNTTSVSTATYYINGVTIEAPTSDTRSFAITVPNGNSTSTFTFTVDTSGNVVVTES